jgi:hypothetical protein
LQWHGAAPVLFRRPMLWLATYSRDTSRHLWRKYLLPRRTLQRPRRNRLRIWPWTSARFCTRRIRNEGLLLALFFLSATFGTRLGCTLVSARSSFQVRAWQTHARMHGSSQITHRFVLRFVNSATKYPRCARTRPVLSCHGFRPGPCPRSTLARGWYGLLSSFCTASTIPTGHLPKKFHMAVAAATYHLPE